MRNALVATLMVLAVAVLGTVAALVWMCLYDDVRREIYGHANDVGRQFAADYAQYLKDNPRRVGDNYLGHIIDDMAKHRHSPANGYAVGFW